MTPDSQLAIVTATTVEAKAARRHLPGMRVIEAGIALRKRREGFGDCVVSCGLAGGLRHDLPTGTVLIPSSVGRPDGSTLHCDPELVAIFVVGARALGFDPCCDPLVTTTHLVRGADRAHWAAQGYAAVDMETGLLDAPRVAAVRVVLDTPLRELSEEWLNPLLAMLKPWNWPELLWLARHGPRCAAMAAQVIAASVVPASHAAYQRAACPLDS